MEKVQRLVDILASCSHHGFPVVENGTKKMEAGKCFKLLAFACRG